MRCRSTRISVCRPGGIEARQDLGFRAALTFVTTPNAPSGRGYPTRELDALCKAQRGVVVLDEAYVDFAGENALKLALKYPHVLVARTFSKAYSLCFQRVGYFVGHRDLIAALHKIRDSYNVNGLGQIAAEATLDDLPYYRANFKKIIATREWLSRELTKLGFRVSPSRTNFILVRPPRFRRRRGCKACAPESPRALVWPAGGEELFAHHRSARGGSGGFGRAVRKILV
jgi:histidinol-phosphate/aromatic aminotransferase/cobyric acid decarboxylase-like protein